MKLSASKDRKKHTSNRTKCIAKNKWTCWMQLKKCNFSFKIYFLSGQNDEKIIHKVVKYHSASDERVRNVISFPSSWEYRQLRHSFQFDIFGALETTIWCSRSNSSQSNGSIESPSMWCRGHCHPSPPMEDGGLAPQ